MSCWGSLSSTAWTTQWEICCLLICSLQVLCQCGSGGYSTFLSTFLRNSQASAALKSSTKTCSGSATCASLMMSCLDCNSPSHVPTFNLLNWAAPKTCWSLRPLSTDVMTPLYSLLKSMVIIIRHLSRGAGPLAFAKGPSLRPAHSRLEIMVGMRSFAGRLWAL